jgi:hypothetical protein
MKQQTFPSTHFASAIFILMREAVFYKKRLIVTTSFLFMFLLDLRRFFSQSLPLLPTHSRCQYCSFSHDHNQTHTKVGRTPLDEGSARCRDLYLTTQTLTKDKHPCLRWDSNPLSQQALGRKSTP